MARGTDFGGVHSYYDLNLIQQKVEVDPAEPKLNLIEIPGADGYKDMTEQPAGRVTYKPRKITWTFGLYPGENWHAKHRQVSNVLNGRRCHISLDDDPSYYYDGRLIVKNHKVDGILKQIVVEATCQPYKLKQNVTRVLVPFCGKNLFNKDAIDEIAGSGVTLTPTDTGIRATWKQSDASFKVVKLLPMSLIQGRTVTISAKISTGGNGQPWLRMGYSDASGGSRVSRGGITKTGKMSTTVWAVDAAKYEYLVLWFYANIDQPASGMSTADYVDYNELQVEISATATAFEAYTPTTDPKTVTLVNDRKPVVPTIVTTGETTLTFGNTSATLAAGTHKLLSLQLQEGEAPVTLQGEGIAGIIYQEGSL